MVETLKVGFGQVTYVFGEPGRPVEAKVEVPSPS